MTGQQSAQCPTQLKRPLKIYNYKNFIHIIIYINYNICFKITYKPKLPQNGELCKHLGQV